MADLRNPNRPHGKLVANAVNALYLAYLTEYHQPGLLAELYGPNAEVSPEQFIRDQMAGDGVGELAEGDLVNLL